MDALDYVFQTALTVTAVLLTFVLVRSHDNKKYKKERINKLDDFIKNIIIELEYNKRILEEPDGSVNKYHYVRDYYFKSSLSSGLIHLVKNDVVQKLLPMTYHELNMYKETPSRIKYNLTLHMQVGSSPKNFDMDDEVKVMDDMRVRLIKQIKLIVDELKKSINDKK